MSSAVLFAAWTSLSAKLAALELHQSGWMSGSASKSPLRESFILRASSINTTFSSFRNSILHVTYIPSAPPPLPLELYINDVGIPSKVEGGPDVCYSLVALIAIMMTHSLVPLSTASDTEGPAKAAYDAALAHLNQYELAGTKDQRALRILGGALHRGLSFFMSAATAVLAVLKLTPFSVPELPSQGLQPPQKKGTGVSGVKIFKLLIPTLLSLYVGGRSVLKSTNYLSTLTAFARKNPNLLQKLYVAANFEAQRVAAAKTARDAKSRAMRTSEIMITDGELRARGIQVILASSRLSTHVGATHILRHSAAITGTLIDLFVRPLSRDEAKSLLNVDEDVETVDDDSDDDESPAPLDASGGGGGGGAGGIRPTTRRSAALATTTLPPIAAAAAPPILPQRSSAGASLVGPLIIVGASRNLQPIPFPTVTTAIKNALNDAASIIVAPLAATDADTMFLTPPPVANCVESSPHIVLIIAQLSGTICTGAGTLNEFHIEESDVSDSLSTTVLSHMRERKIGNFFSTRGTMVGALKLGDMAKKDKVCSCAVSGCSALSTCPIIKSRGVVERGLEGDDRRYLRAFDCPLLGALSARLSSCKACISLREKLSRRGREGGAVAALDATRTRADAINAVLEQAADGVASTDALLETFKSTVTGTSASATTSSLLISIVHLAQQLVPRLAAERDKAQAAYEAAMEELGERGKDSHMSLAEDVHTRLLDLLDTNKGEDFEEFINLLKVPTVAKQMLKMQLREALRPTPHQESQRRFPVLLLLACLELRSKGGSSASELLRNRAVFALPMASKVSVNLVQAAYTSEGVDTEKILSLYITYRLRARSGFKDPYWGVVYDGIHTILHILRNNKGDIIGTSCSIEDVGLERLEELVNSAAAPSVIGVAAGASVSAASKISRYRNLSSVIFAKEVNVYMVVNLLTGEAYPIAAFPVSSPSAAFIESSTLSVIHALTVRCFRICSVACDGASSQMKARENLIARFPSELPLWFSAAADKQNTLPWMTAPEYFKTSRYDTFPVSPTPGAVDTNAAALLEASSEEEDDESSAGPSQTAGFRP
jgi:hypothetical protein